MNEWNNLWLKCEIERNKKLYSVIQILLQTFNSCEKFPIEINTMSMSALSQLGLLQDAQTARSK